MLDPVARIHPDRARKQLCQQPLTGPNPVSSSAQMVNLNSCPQRGHRKTLSSVPRTLPVWTETTLISAPHWQSGRSDAPGVSRRSNFDTLIPPPPRGGIAPLVKTNNGWPPETLIGGFARPGCNCRGERERQRSSASKYFLPISRPNARQIRRCRRTTRFLPFRIARTHKCGASGPAVSV